MAKIKLGIDAKWYFEGPPSGRVVVMNLVDTIISQKNERFEIFLIIDKKFIKEAQNTFDKTVQLIPIVAKPSIISNLFTLPFAVKRLNLDLILFQNFVSFLPSKWKKIAYIHDVLFLDFPEFFKPLELTYFKYMSKLAKNADFVVTISESEQARLIKHGISSSDKTKVIYHGVNEKFMPLAAYPTHQITQVRDQYLLPHKFLLYVGRINIRKNILNLVKSLAFVQEDIKLVVVGKRDAKEEGLNEYITSHQLEDRIIFTGHVADSDLYLIYAMATAFCFPSFAEGFGLPPLEAMKCGVPAIVSNSSVMPEICGEAGIYVEPSSPKDIAAKLNMLLADAEFYQTKAAQALKHSALFTWDKAAKKLLDYLYSISNQQR